MLSRVAGSIYWMFRYLERAQNIARFINADFNQFLEDQGNQGNLWSSLVAVTGDLEFFHEHYDQTTRENVIRFLTLDESYPNSILNCVSQARENARTVRESISSEMWEELNSLYLEVREFRNGEGRTSDPYLFCKAVINSCYNFIGLFYSTMNRGDAWHFGRIGMLLERADKTSRILDVKYFVLLPDPSWVGSAYDNTQWAALLKAVSGLEMYRKAYRRINPKDVAEFLVFDRSFPRSILHCVHYAEDSLKVLSGTPRDGALNDAQRSLFRLRTDLETGTVAEAMDAGLHDYLDSLQNRLNQVDEAVFHVFFETKIGNDQRTDHGNLGQHQS
jgi:uncharacterized alpha-E superfamily protein